MKVPYYEVHSFTNEPGAGNPAGVCPLSTWLPEAEMQAIAAEKNLSETAFFVRRGDGYVLRWFAPSEEVDLCGHATLAAAHILFTELGFIKPTVTFHTRSGALQVTRRGRTLTLDFPVIAMTPCEAPEALVNGLGVRPSAVFRGMDYVAVFENEADVVALSPNLEALSKLDLRGVVATAPGGQSDYVCRCFAPKMGIAEDPVTGSAQCALAPYWTEKLQKRRLEVIQRSARGGRLTCEVRGDRVFISGEAVTYLKEIP